MVRSSVPISARIKSSGLGGAQPRNGCCWPLVHAFSRFFALPSPPPIPIPGLRVHGRAGFLSALPRGRAAGYLWTLQSTARSLWGSRAKVMCRGRKATRRRCSLDLVRYRSVTITVCADALCLLAFGTRQRERERERRSVNRDEKCRNEGYGLDQQYVTLRTGSLKPPATITRPPRRR
ncbi:hypothetical protein LZ31DRAFT_162782 [Colletotrichum somersetense]|nr:hypothetical protein LZ31DRAFT_162782 [Colletotrichum somersetense]